MVDVPKPDSYAKDLSDNPGYLTHFPSGDEPRYDQELRRSGLLTLAPQHVLGANPQKKGPVQYRISSLFNDRRSSDGG